MLYEQALVSNLIACALLLRVKTVRVLQLKYRRQKPQRSLTWHSSSSAFPRKHMFTQWFSPATTLSLFTALHVTQNDSVPDVSQPAVISSTL